MKISQYKVFVAALAVILCSKMVSAQTGSQSSTPAKKPAAGATGSTGAKSSTAAKPAGPGYDRALLTPSLLKATAPAEFDVKFTTTKGGFTVHVTRAWAPLGADRFYNLAKHHFFDGAAFFRVIPGFVAQFGISAYPAVAKVWDTAKIKDDPVIHHNTPGTLVFATAGANTRTTQLFINYNDNSRSLDGQGFSPFGEVTEGMDVVKNLYGGYGGDLDQDKITAGGKDYIAKNYPQMDIIKSTVVVEPPKPAAAPKPKATPPKSTTPKPASTPKSQNS